MSRWTVVFHLSRIYSIGVHQKHVGLHRFYQWAIFEASALSLVKSGVMRTKHLLTMAAVIAAATYATSAHAGVSFHVSVGWPAPVYVQSVRAPACGPKVMVAPPSRVSCRPPVFVRSPYAPVCAPVRVPPGRVWKHHNSSRHHVRKSDGHDRRQLRRD